MRFQMKLCVTISFQYLRVLIPELPAYMVKHVLSFRSSIEHLYIPQCGVKVAHYIPLYDNGLK